MAIYTWDAATKNATATSRLVEQAATLLGATLPSASEMREAVLAELVAQANTYTYTEVVTLLNQLRSARLYGALGNPGLQRVSNFDVNNANALSYTNGGTLKTFGATTTFDTGTTKTIPTTKWAAFLCTINASGTAVVTWTASSYGSEALAIAALAMPDATSTPIGYVTVQAHASGFTAGTDALNGGTGGNVAAATTYYNSINPNSLILGSAVS